MDGFALLAQLIVLHLSKENIRLIQTTVKEIFETNSLILNFTYGEHDII